MKIVHIKQHIKNKYSKGCLKGRKANSRVIYKTQKQKYKEGLKDFYDSLKDYKDYKGISKETLQKYKEKYKRIFNVYPRKDMSIYDIKKALQAFEASFRG